MIITDAIHGTLEITEPVILELLNCSSLQRLKGIDQGGYTTPYQPNGRKILTLRSLRGSLLVT